MTGFQIPSRLFEFIEMAGFEWVVTPEGTVEFGDDLSGVVAGPWRVVPRGDGWVDVWDVNEGRFGGGANWDSAFPSWEMAERWLLWDIGDTARTRNRLPMVFVPRYSEFLDERCEVKVVPRGDRESAELWCAGELLGVFRHTAPTAGDVFAASHIMPAETDVIAASLLHPEGKPLFSTEITPVPK